MKRRIYSILLVICLAAGMILPCFAEEPTDAEALTETLPEAVSEEASQAENAGETEPSDETAQPTAEERPAELEAESVRTGGSLSTSAEGIAFVNEMMGGSYGGTYQLANAEYAVNAFQAAYGITLSQTQFDALVDFVMAYGGDVLAKGYQIEKVIGGGSFTDVTLANAFCSWVKGSDGSFSQARLNRRLREIKLFLYGSYSGNCEVSFRYVIFYPNGGTLQENTVICYALGGTYGSLPTATRSGQFFAGWFTASSGGEQLCNSHSVTRNYTVYAHWSNTEVQDPNNGSASTEPDPEPHPEPPALKMSEAGVQFIKDNEGFAKYAVWDYGQYSIGYGSRCDPADYPDGITEEEADYLLRVMLADFEKTVDKLLEKSTVSHTQSQYDAIISFTYNLGTQWVNEKYNVYRFFLYGGYTEMELVNSLGSWCRAGGTVLPGLVRRRMDEANMYLNGDYTVGSKTYLCVQFNGAKGTPEYDFYYYKTGTALGALPTATRSGYELTGWYDKVSGGTQYTEQTSAPAYGRTTLYAHWKEASNPPVIDPELGFTDVPVDAWYYEWVKKAVGAGLFKGVTETEFAPNNSMTRAMVVTVLHRMAGTPSASAQHSFADVEDGIWYSDAIRWAFETGIVNGVSATRFGVSESITREQLVAMLYRYATHCGYDTTARADLSVFLDAAAISEYALEPMRWAVANGIVGGDQGSLNPTGKATRAQCAKMLMAFLERFT